MSVETILGVLGAAGFTAIGGAFLINVLVKSGIEAAVKLNFDKHLESYKYELSHELEKLKISLKNSETFFSHQFIALTELRRMSRKLVPRKRTPEMDWYEACEEIASSFSIHADALDEFLCKHEAVLPNDVLQSLENAVSLATKGDFKFTWSEEDEDGAEFSNKGIKMAEKLYEAVREATASLQKAVDSQVDGRT